MPNWSATNYCLRGERSELERFADLLNNMPDNENGFGRYWMGNLLIALGMDRDEVVHGPIHCRGTFDPDPYAQAFFFGPSVDESQTFTVDEDGVMRFSTVSAWQRSQDVEDIIREHFPSFEFFWKSTDEFGNYHVVHDPYDICHFERYQISTPDEGRGYGADGFEQFREDLIGTCEGLDIPADATPDHLVSDAFVRKFCEWRNADESRQFIGFAIWMEEK